ncbi:MAG: hypothetical protein JXM69_21165 [Anaerolineae bacterium]|nr:hypothetical protein [Anaerolineae bacterium]
MKSINSNIRAKKRTMPHDKIDRKTGFILTGLFVIAVLLMAIPSYNLLVKPRGQAFDLFWIWAGGRAILAGGNPYGPETTRIIQLGVFKKIIPPHQYQHGFPHPAHIAFVLLPFIVTPFSWSVLLWLSLQIPLFMVILILGFRLLDWSIRPSLLFPLALLTSLGFRYPINVYVLAQLHFFILFCFLLSIWLFQENHPCWAAIILACTTIRPDLSLLALLSALILARNSSQRNRFIMPLLATGLTLALLPAFFISLHWPFTWINALQNYGSNPFATWPPGLIPLPMPRVIISLLLVAWTGRYIWLEWKYPTLFHKSLMVSAMALLGLIILPQTGSYTLTFALIPAMVQLRYARLRWLQLSIATSLLTPWFYFMLGKPFDRLIFLLIPLQFIVFQEIVVHVNQGPTK